MAKVIKKTKPATKTKAPAKKVAAKPVKKVAAKKPVAKAKPVPKKAAKPAAKKAVAKAKPKVVVKPAKKVVAKKPVAKAKPTAKKVVKPVAKKVIAKAKPIPKKTAKPVKKIIAKVAPKKSIVKKVAPKPVVKKITKPEAKVALKKPTPKPEIKKAEAKPAAKQIQKTSAEKAQQISVQRHINEAKPLMEVSVVRYKDVDLAIFKEVILRKISKAKDEIDFYSDQIKNTSESETQFASIDDGSMTSERENMNQIVVRMQKLISHLESALVRIENKSYGICRETGRLIPKERLLVVPHATLSVEGKKLEKK